MQGEVGKELLPIVRGLAANTKTVDRTVVCLDDFPLDPPCECMQIRLMGSRSQPSLQLIILKFPKTHITKLASIYSVGPDTNLYHT